MKRNGTSHLSRAVPVPPIDLGTGNQFPEPPGTSGTDPFEPLAAFLARTKDLPPVSWLIDGVVPDSGNLLLVSAPGVGKTLFALHIAKTAADMDRPVFIVLEEGRPRSIFDRFTALAFRTDAPVFIAHRKGVHLDDKAVRTHMANHLRSHEAPVLILDPFSSLFLGDENDTRAVNEAKEHIQALATINPRALIAVLHHTSKAGERGEGPAIYAARGSTVLPGWADVQVNLTRENTPRGEGQLAFVAQVAKGRDGETDQRYRFTLSLLNGTVLQEAVSEASAQDKAQEVRQALASAANPLSKTKLAGMVRGRRQDVLRVINGMEARGELKREGDGYTLASATGLEVTSGQEGEDG
ncbi:AAA family ATPase [Stigmatella hybrida]|uniref:AAA family ATPase n=1 Tax=Stigmatella hybrida TaxID=394097 RepID=UPI001CDABC34|nr:AAA family ATPase [Stigmatella hybrida]